MDMLSCCSQTDDMFHILVFTGGITAGIISDYTGARAGTCAIMLILAAPMVWIILSHSVQC